MLEALLNVVIPVFAVAGLGFWYAGYKPFPVGAMTDLIIHMTAGCLVFDALSSADRFAADAIRIPLSAAGIIFGGVGVGFVAHKTLPALQSMPRGAVILPVAFMNAGNLGLPLLKLAFGEEGLELGMLFFVTFAAFQYSLGIALVKGKGGMREVFRIPLLYAAVLGIAANQLSWTPPKVIAVPIHMLAETVIPMMLLSLGARMRSLVKPASGAKKRAWWPLVVLPALRMGAGFLVAMGVNALMGNQGIVAKVTLVLGCLPPAVMNFALVEKYGEDPEAAAAVSGAIAVGTVTAVVLLPPVVGALIG